MTHFVPLSQAQYLGFLHEGEVGRRYGGRLEDLPADGDFEFFDDDRLGAAVLSHGVPAYLSRRASDRFARNALQRKDPPPQETLRHIRDEPYISTGRLIAKA